MSKITKYRGIMFEVFENGDCYRLKKCDKTFRTNQHKKYYWQVRFTNRSKINFRDNGNGYMATGISNGYKRVTVYQHRLVAYAFNKNRNKSLQVNHKDFNTKNNSISNLEIVTAKENVHYSIKKGRIRTISQEDFENIVKEYYEGYSVDYLAKKYNYGQSTIHSKMEINGLKRRNRNNKNTIAWKKFYEKRRQSKLSKGN